MRLTALSAVAGLLAAALPLASTPASAEELTVITAGDQNMVDYVNNFLAPAFEKQNPGTTVRVVGTGPGDAGSQKIVERLDAQKKAGKDVYDVDVAVIHEKVAGKLVQDGLLDKYRGNIDTGKLVTRGNAKLALGADVDGYVMPMFNSQTAIAYNPDLVPNPPKTFDELVAWTEKNPKQFGYNGIKGGASGVSFVISWIYNYAGDAKVLQEGPYDAGEKAKWDDAFAKLKAFNKNVALTPGNAGTLDMLSRGEIAMGAVWVDMFYSWKANGQLPPTMKLVLPAPGMPGQPMHYVIPGKTAHKALAEKFIALATSPDVQANGIVKQFNWYPGIDAKYVQDKLDPAIWQKLFTDISPDDLAKYGKSFPIGPYYADLLEAYEKKVAE